MVEGKIISFFIELTIIEHFFLKIQNLLFRLKINSNLKNSLRRNLYNLEYFMLKN